MYETILVPTDGSTEGDKGGREAVGLAAALGATLHGLYVVQEGGNPWESEPMEDQLSRAEEYGQGVLDEVGGQAADAGVSYESDVKVGPAVHEKIIEYAEENDVDLIVMGSGYHGQIGGLLGSTADKVLRAAEIPVLTVRRTDRE
ncbi:MAG TPA: universal stress protein [Halobacteriales archaeon]|nr:universal stress protein [Halobacteriales archaeon]